MGVYLLYGAFYILCVKPNFGCVFMDILLEGGGAVYIVIELWLTKITLHVFYIRFPLVLE